MNQKSILLAIKVRHHLSGTKWNIFKIQQHNKSCQAEIKFNRHINRLVSWGDWGVLENQSN